MFSDSKYTRCYYRIINDAKSRKLNQECQRHHVVPKSLGGDNSKENIVRVTPREHYVCHLLLVKMTHGRNRSKMIFAFFRFKPKGSGVNSSIAYARFVTSFKKHLTGEDNHFFGKKHTSETKALISANHGMRGRSCYDVWVEKYGEAEAERRKAVMLERRSRSLAGDLNPMFGYSRTVEQKERHSKDMTGAGNPNFGKAWAWINRDASTKRILKTTLNSYLQEGWQLGRIRRV